MRRGRRPLVVLYRRLQGVPDDSGQTFSDGDQRELAEYVVEVAAAEQKGAPEAMLLLALVAIDAGRDDLARWLQYPAGEANRFLDDRDRALIAEFPKFVERVRSARELPEPEKTELLAALGPHGRIRLDAFLRRHTYDERQIAELEKRAYRFLERARTGDKAPAILRTLPAFLPIGLTLALEESAAASTVAKAGAGTAAVGVVVLALALWPASTSRPTDNTTADTVIPIELDGPKLVLGWNDGRWRIVAPDGTLVLEDETLKLPRVVEGGAAGQLTGDDTPELVLYTSVPLEAQHEPSGIFVFGRDADRWRLIDKLPTHEGVADAAACADLAKQLATSELTLALHRARQKCPSRIGAVSIRDRSLYVAQLHYGREYLRASCTLAGCRPLERVLAVDADVTSLAWLGERAVLGTGCWNRFGSSAYGVLVHEREGDTFTWTGGRTTVAAIDDRRLAVLAGSPCEGTFQQAAVAAGADGPNVTLHQRTLAIAELDRGTLRFVDETRLDPCCGEDPALAIARDGGAPRWLAVAYRHEDGEKPYHQRVYDLRSPHAAQAPLDVELPARPLTLATSDLDGDGKDELLVGSNLQGTRAFAIAGDRLRRVEW